MKELINAIATHTYPQYFSHSCLTSELFYLDVKRFPTLFGVAKSNHQTLAMAAVTLALSFSHSCNPVISTTHFILLMNKKHLSESPDKT